ncbi:MAG: mandelate racemase/muconate lactonizing enzyme family protein [Xanthobacteraceae bacterium]
MTQSKQHKIARVTATPLRVLSDFGWLGVSRQNAAPVCFVEVETDTGLKGHGVTQHADPPTIATQINGVAEKLKGLDALANERIWHVLYWTLSGGAQVQYASWAISAIDVALWDIKGKALGQPIWKLLGGARDKVQAYATIGVPGADIEQLCEAARRLVAMGFKCLKTQAGRPGLDNLRGQKPMIEIVRNDSHRIKALREAVGDEIEIGIDAQCRLDLIHAMELVRLIEPYHVGFFEEPLVQNDVLLMADMRRRTRIPIHAGQSEGLGFRFRDMLMHNAIDMLQPNTAVTGGITNCVRIAGLASAFNVPINGGGFLWHNMHVQGGVAAGTTLEYQTASIKTSEAIFTGMPPLDKDWITLPETPGLGFDPKPEMIKEFTIK